jgi:hypothetical protein
VNAVFSSSFKTDLVREETKYAEVSERLSGDLHERVAGLVREVIKWKGGDHVGPHGFPCRRAKPFPFYIYYKIEGETIYFLGLVHERRHPDFLKQQLSDDRFGGV